MKLRNLSRLLLFAFVIMCVAPSCVKEGPMGAAGADGINGTDGTNGADGADGTVSCLACHAGTAMDQKKSQFTMSEHSVGAIAVDYAGGRSGCAQCHSSQGFIAYATLGIKDQAVANPGAWECNTCHGLHSTFKGTDYALRLGAAPVTSNISSTYKFDFKNNSNLCVNCHQARTAEPNTATPGTTFKITSTHYGPHHGPQGNVVAGVGFAQIAGSVAYPAPGTGKHFAPACTGCHMATFDTAKKQGGHSLVPSLAACNTCHGATDTNYNHGGTQTLVEEKLVELRDKLMALGVIEYVDVDGVMTYEPKVGTYPMLYAQAYYNWIGIEEDRSLGAHNPTYVKALLLNTLEALNKIK